MILLPKVERLRKPCCLIWFVILNNIILLYSMSVGYCKSNRLLGLVQYWKDGPQLIFKSDLEILLQHPFQFPVFVNFCTGCMSVTHNPFMNSQDFTRFEFQDEFQTLFRMLQFSVLGTIICLLCMCWSTERYLVMIMFNFIKFQNCECKV